MIIQKMTPGTAEYNSDLDRWSNNFYDTHPGATVSDWSTARYQFWVDNNCTAALQRYKDADDGKADPTVMNAINQEIQSVITASYSSTSTPTTIHNTPNPFMCPENYKTETERINALADFFAVYQKSHPSATGEDIQIYRYNFLVSHSCNQTLENMQRDITPVTSPMIRFIGKDFGPQVIKFSDDTKVLTAYYPLKGQDLDNFDEESAIQLLSAKYLEG